MIVLYLPPKYCHLARLLIAFHGTEIFVLVKKDVRDTPVT